MSNSDLKIKQMLMQPEFADIIQVLEFGATKYEPNNWLQPDGAKSSHKDMCASIFRHAAEVYAGRTEDGETGLHPALHLAVRALMLYTRYKRGIIHPADIQDKSATYKAVERYVMGKSSPKIILKADPITAVDVAAYIEKYAVDRKKYLSCMQIIHLVYYCQCAYISEYGQLLFDDRIEAWIDGPMILNLYELVGSDSFVSFLDYGDSDKILIDDVYGEIEKTIDYVLDRLINAKSQQLKDWISYEQPFLDARKPLLPGERGRSEMTKEALLEYYGKYRTLWESELESEDLY